MSKYNQGFLVLHDDKSCQGTRKTVGCFPAFFFSFGIPNFVQGLKSHWLTSSSKSQPRLFQKKKVSHEGGDVADNLFLQQLLPTCRSAYIQKGLVWIVLHL